MLGVKFNHVSERGHWCVWLHILCQTMSQKLICERHINMYAMNFSFPDFATRDMESAIEEMAKAW